MRLFLAIPASYKLKEQIGDFLKEKPFKANWVKKENLHITLKFLGEVEEKKAKYLEENMDNILKPLKYKELSYEMASSFPNEKRPRVLFLKFEEDLDILNYQKNLEATFEKEGFKKEDKEFKIHLTIARFKYPPENLKFKKFLEEASKVDFSPFCVERIVLYQSILMKEGPLYKPLRTIECLR